jgi:predicted phosphodiesterase
LANTIKIAVISDLHCKHSSAEGPVKSTLLYSDDITGTELTNPIKALKKLIKMEEIICDILICPGDIADKADPQGLSSGWNYLESIRTALDAKILVATVGNHDVNTRCLPSEDPNAVLLSLDEKFPIPDPALQTQYWHEAFCTLPFGDSLLFIFNSCYTHRNPDSGKKSQIDQAHLLSIGNHLKEINTQGYKYKIAICHHHPINHGNLSVPDDDLISNGDELVKLLEMYGFQIVIHGHKHEPRLSYKDSIPVFCAGSLSSTQNVNDLRIENTFHVIELNEYERKGVIDTWVLIPRRGWIKKLDTFFPCFTGFGYRGNINELAQKCITWLKIRNVDSTTYKSLKKEIPELDFLTPTDQIFLNEELILKNAELTPPLPNPPKFIGLTYSKDEYSA